MVIDMYAEEVPWQKHLDESGRCNISYLFLLTVYLGIGNLIRCFKNCLDFPPLK